MYSSIF